MTPEINHLGHASFTVNYAGARLLTDPWFNPAFLSSWFPWPDNRHLKQAAYGDFVYLSHHHEDHFDRQFLNELDKDITVLVPKFRSRYLEKEVRKLGFENVISLKHGEQFTLVPGFVVTMLLDRSHKEDSALVMDMGGYRFVDSNDCELALSDWPNQVDMLACQFSGAFWYPHCYNYKPDKMADKAAEVRTNNFERLCSRINRTGAKAYWPSAGPACFLDPALPYELGRSGIFPEWKDVDLRFRTEFPEVSIVEPTPGGSMHEYQKSRKHEWLPWYDAPDTPATTEEIDAHFRQLQRANSRFLGAYQNDIRLDPFLLEGWNIRLGQLSCVLEDRPPDPHYWLNVPNRVLRAVLDGRSTWESALLSMRITLDRKPDEYDLTLMSLLEFGDRPAITTEMAKQRNNNSAETIERDGLVMQRWCPHAGEDLTFARLRDGVIECPRHNWKWDVDTGKCIKGGKLPLRIDTMKREN